MTQELYHIGTSGYGLQILCENIFYKDDVLFLLVSVKNSSAGRGEESGGDGGWEGCEWGEEVVRNYCLLAKRGIIMPL